MRYVKVFARVVSRVPKKFIRVTDKVVGSFQDLCEEFFKSYARFI